MVLPIFKVKIIRNKNCLYNCPYLVHLHSEHVHCTISMWEEEEEINVMGKENERTNLHPCDHTWLWLNREPQQA